MKIKRLGMGNAIATYQGIMLDASPFTYKIYGPAMYMACHLFMLHQAP